MAETMLELMKEADLEGYYKHSGRNTNEYRRALKETVDLLANRHGLPLPILNAKIYEALTTSDFPLLFGDVLDRQLLAAYREAPTVMPQIAKPARLRDMRTVYRFKVSDGDNRLSEVEEQGEYKGSDRDESKWEYAPKKYGRRFPISWETLLNDDLNALTDTPRRFGVAARRTEEYFLTSLFFDSNGPKDAYFAGNGGAAAVASLALNIENLETGIQAMDDYVDDNDEPIDNTAKFLMVPPALRLTAMNIMKSMNKMYIIAGDTDVSAYAMPTANILAELDMVILVNRYIPRIVTSGTKGQTCWALFSDPNLLPACEFGKLAGHEEPEIFMKTSNQTKVSGGPSGPMEGSFENDTVQYKVRHVFGGTTLDGRAGWASDGQ